MSPLLVLQNLAHNSTATLAVVKVRNNYHYEESEIYRPELAPILLPVTLSALVKVGKEGASKERRGGFVYSKLKKKKATCLNHGKTQVTKLGLVLLLHLIGRDSGASVLDQSWSEVKRNQNNQNQFQR